MGCILATTSCFARRNARPGSVFASWIAGLCVAFGLSCPLPVIAAVELASGTLTERDRIVMQELAAAFDRAEVAVQQADLGALMRFYANGYNYHGLKRADVRRVWDEVFTHYGQVTSKHVFTELKVIKAGKVRKASVTCTGGLYGIEQATGKPVTIDNWVNEVHFLVKEQNEWRFLGNAGGPSPSAPPASAPHHPLF
jgi:hypothetical protein